ncbi:MAG TPA: cation diffusion facilitator family transporter [Ktedonobacteraceae bacterium]|nr:cation diffusion facilitator family transporter [Ktedonobacteraceae bacterium]
MQEYRGDSHQVDTHQHHHSEHDHDQDEHDHDDHGHGHGHGHGAVNAELYSNEVGLRAVQISTGGMLLVSLIQFGSAAYGGSAGLFADALHNQGDVFTTVALWIAFALSRRAANQRYTYGYYRSEDLAGIFIVLVIIASAVAGAVESIQKLTSGNVPTQIYLSMGAALVGVAGNELLAQYKISVGRRINSVPLIADGQHSRIDGLTSLAAFVGLVGVALGFPSADPIAGLVITVVIVTVVYSTSRSVLQRILDAVDPNIVPAIVRNASQVEGVKAVTDVHARWVGHTLQTSLNIEVSPQITLAEAHTIAEEVRHRLFHNVKDLSEAIIHTDPYSPTGEYHAATAHHLEGQRPAVPRYEKEGT